eukprot:352854-Chlamydomonas_euryale.AAC.3
MHVLRVSSLAGQRLLSAHARWGTNARMRVRVTIADSGLNMGMRMGKGGCMTPVCPHFPALVRRPSGGRPPAERRVLQAIQASDCTLAGSDCTPAGSDCTLASYALGVP